MLFGDQSRADPWLLTALHCLLCGAQMSEEVVVRVHPPTAGAGVLCLGGGVRGIETLKLMTRIQDRIGLPTPFQKFFQVAFDFSSGTSFLLFTLARAYLERRAYYPAYVHERALNY